MNPNAANAEFRFQSISSFRSITFCTSKSEKDVLQPDNMTPKPNGYLAGIYFIFVNSDDDAIACALAPNLRAIIEDAIVFIIEYFCLSYT